MIFSFWTGSDPADVPEIKRLIDAWRPIDPDFVVYGASDVLDVVAQVDPAAVDIVSRIRIPSPFSDVARSALLYAFGGYFVDAHTLPGNPDNIALMLNLLKHHEGVFFDMVIKHKRADDKYLMASPLGAPKGSPVILDILRTILSKLKAHELIEHEAAGYVPYNISALCGPWVVMEQVVEVRYFPKLVRPQYDGRITVVPFTESDAERPFRLYRNYSYRQPGQHWSERQNSEPLFFPRKETNHD